MLPKRPLQDRLSQALSALEVGFDGGFEFFGDGEAVVDFGYYLTLLVKRRKWNANRFNQTQIWVWLNSTGCNFSRIRALEMKKALAGEVS